MNEASLPIPSLAPEAWQRRRAAHRQRLSPFVEAHHDRRQRGESHPVLDFLFTYYSARPSLLLTWSPGAGAVLEQTAKEAWVSRRWYREVGAGDMLLDPARFPAARRRALRWTLDLLRAIEARPPRHGCYGLHEWAMVYRLPRVRHDSTPLRLSKNEIEQVVEAGPLCCSHHDAFRFFTPAARPLNRLHPGPDQRVEMEQSGCLHVNMDLYKWCYKFHPWLPAELMADAFLLAVEAREVDMRASPYDVSALGYEPIPIETEAGRALYRREQENIREKAAPLRRSLIDALMRLESMVLKSAASQPPALEPR